MSPVFLWHKTFIVDTNTPVDRQIRAGRTVAAPAH